MPAESRPTPAGRRVPWVEKEVFCEQKQRRGRAEEVSRGRAGPPGEAGTAGRPGAGPRPPAVASAEGSLQPGLWRAGVQRVFTSSGFREPE